MSINTDNGVVLEHLHHGRYFVRTNLSVVASVLAEKARLRVREDVRNFAQLRRV